MKKIKLVNPCTMQESRKIGYKTVIISQLERTLNKYIWYVLTDFILLKNVLYLQMNVLMFNCSQQMCFEDMGQSSTKVLMTRHTDMPVNEHVLPHVDAHAVLRAPKHREQQKILDMQPVPQTSIFDIA